MSRTGSSKKTPKSTKSRPPDPSKSSSRLSGNTILTISACPPKVTKMTSKILPFGSRWGHKSTKSRPGRIPKKQQKNSSQQIRKMFQNDPQKGRVNLTLFGFFGHISPLGHPVAQKDPPGSLRAGFLTLCCRCLSTCSCIFCCVFHRYGKHF